MHNYLILILILLSLDAQPTPSLSLYPFANHKFDLIYRISNGTQYSYLHIACKEKNTLSLSISNTLQFDEHPRFPIFGNVSDQQSPRMQRSLYTFLSHCAIKVEVMKDDMLVLRRKGSQKVLFKIKSVMTSQGYNKIVTEDESVKWGMGERFQRKLSLTDGMWTIWNRDRPFEIDQGNPLKSGQTYGHQPIYLARNTNTKLFHIVYFKNTFAMNLEVTRKSTAITYHSVGGNIHFIIMLGGDDPEPLLQHYHDYIGRIHLPPFWAMGWHQCRWGYKSLSILKEVVSRYNQQKIPLDTLWSDLDYMRDKAVFTVDENNYPPHQFTILLQEQNLHWVPLIDAGISLADHIGTAGGKGVFVKTKKGEDYIGEVWPGPVHYVDYLHPQAEVYWKSQLHRLFIQIPFSGVWLDMNEPSNFHGNNPIKEQYHIQHAQSLNIMTIDADLLHYCHNQSICKNGFQHAQVHAYYGHLSTVATFNFLKRYGRPFIISRSNSVGTGRFAGHWTGDNNAQWDFLKLSIGANFLYQIFGIQMVGADVCGFHDNTSQQLCGRWMQLGSLYPFARSHNQNESKPQQPYSLGQQVLDTSRMVLRDRYSLLKQMYTYLFTLNGVGSFFRPLFFQFFDDEYTYIEDVSQTQFLLGRGLMSAPIIGQNQVSRQVYFPGLKQLWYDITMQPKDPTNNTNTPLKVYNGNSFGNVTNKLPSPVPLFLRGGYMILTNEPKLRSKHLTNKFQIMGGFSSQGKIIGEIMNINDYNNETSIQNCILNGCTTKLQIQQLQANKIKLKWSSKGPGQIEIVKIKVWRENKRLIYEGDSLPIKGLGEKIIEMVI